LPRRGRFTETKRNTTASGNIRRREVNEGTEVVEKPEKRTLALPPDTDPELKKILKTIAKYEYKFALAISKGSTVVMDRILKKARSLEKAFQRRVQEIAPLVRV
jgi:hypothetical protein